MNIKGTIYEEFYDDLYLPDTKIRFLEETYFGKEATKQTILYNFRKSAHTERKFKKDLCILNIEEINDVAEGLGYTSENTIRTALSYFSTYVDWCIVNKLRGSHEDNINNITIFAATQDLSKFTSKIKNKNKYVTKEEVYRLTDSLVNHIDKAIMLGIYESISGKEMYELRSLIIENVDFNTNRVILTSSDDSMRVITISDKLKHILKYANSQKEYIKGNGKLTSRNAPIMLIKNDYILRTQERKDTKKDDMMDYHTLSQKFYQLKQYTDYKFITPQSLRDSGAMNRVLELTKERGLSEPNDEIFNILQLPSEYNYSRMQIFDLKKKFDLATSLKSFK